MNREAAKAFVKKWQNHQGKEREDKFAFWSDFCCNVLEVDSFFDFARSEKPITVAGVYNGPKVRDVVSKDQSQMDLGIPVSKRASTTKAADFYIPSSRVIIEHKSRGVDLDKPEEQSDGAKLTPFFQARRYDNGLTQAKKAHYIILCDFQEFRIFDLNNPKDLLGDSYTSVKLEELDRHLDLFDFLIHEHKEELKKQKDVSTEAAKRLGTLYDVLREEYELNDWPQHDLVILCVRLLFCLYAEDSGLFEKNAFHNYLLNKKPDQNDGEMREALHRLFNTLNTKESERDPFLSKELSDLPYVNGGLFADEIQIPYFTYDSKTKLLLGCSQEFLWDSISPTIFGALFESIVSGELRRTGGMHYTSPENIHKVTRPLFLNDYELDFRKAGNSSKKLHALQDKISSATFFDPACGSGNFLTQTYIDLRNLEDRILERLIDPDETGQGALGADPSIQQKVSISQFYGIEINDFAVSVAQTALQIALHQCNEKTNTILFNQIETLPLEKNNHIVQGNALREDWNTVLPAERCTYIFGNPPFYGAMELNDEQKKDIQNLFSDIKGAGELDYVCGWYKKAALYSDLHSIPGAFVSTNSICQGLHVTTFGRHMKIDLGLSINFAYPSFVWSSDATDKAQVHCVIVGFSKVDKPKKCLFYENGSRLETDKINSYLLPAEDIFIAEKSKPISDAPNMHFGNMPRGKDFFLTPAQKDDFLARDPDAAKWIRRFLGATEFTNNKERYCLWLVDASADDISGNEDIENRVKLVRSQRLGSKAEETKKMAETPHLFAQIAQPIDGSYLLVPRHSTQQRDYVPIGFIDSKIICGDANLLIPNAKLYHFGIMTSQIHNAWMRVVCGRIKSDYRYSKDIVYNNFIWPKPTKKQKETIESCAKTVLEVRKKYQGKSLNDIYNRNTMPSDLRIAHKALDKAVEAAYGVKFNGDEEKIVAHLFRLYAEATKDEA